MKKNEKEINKGKVIPGMWWLAMLSLMSFLVVLVIGYGYQSIYWQMVDYLGENIALNFRTEQLTMIMTTVTNFGYYGTLFMWLLLAGVLTTKRDTNMLIVGLLLSVGGFSVGSLIKTIVARIRPEEFALLSETSHSFPSLHAMTSMVLYLFVSYLVYYYSRRFWRSYVIFLIGIILAILIGLSRVYLGVHYLTDVFAGFSLGIGWFLLILFSEKCFWMILKSTDGSPKI